MSEHGITKKKEIIHNAKLLGTTQHVTYIIVIL